MALVDILEAGGMPPSELCNFCADLKDEYRQRWLPADVWIAARPAAAFNKLVDFTLLHSAASLERLTLFLPLRHARLPEMGRLKHLTLQLDGTFEGFVLKGMPELRYIVFLHANTAEDDCIGPMRLTGLQHLQSLYLGNVVPSELFLPPGCAVHLHCSNYAGGYLSGKPGWYQAQMQLQSLCNRLPDAALPYQARIFLPEHSLVSLSAISIVASTKVNVGTLATPISFMQFPALQRVMLESAGNMYIYIPKTVHLKRLWARRLKHLYIWVESAHEFVQHIDAMRLDVDTYDFQNRAEVMAALEERGTPLVMRQPHRAAAPTYVIEGCMYDSEAARKPACACQICLDCLVRRTCRPSEMPAAMDRVFF